MRLTGSPAIPALILAAIFALCECPGGVRAQEQKFKELKPRIAALIKQLGDNDFATREQAQAELQRMGVVAFDALRRAQTDDDLEIARRARYLVRSIQVRWARPGDPETVVRVLEQYGQVQAGERNRLLDRLSSFPDHLGVAALCRAARFEANDGLSQRAALLVAQMEPPKEKAKREALAEAILGELGVSKRESTDWLRAHAEVLREPASAADSWEKIVTTAIERRDRLPDETNDKQVLDLLKIYINVLIQLDRRDEAIAKSKRMLPLIRARRDTLLDAIDWLMDRKLFSVIDELAALHPQRVDRFLSLRYRLAESLKRQGRLKQAEQVAKQALEAQTESLESHIEAAVELQERSQLEWCLRELKSVIDRSEPVSLHHLRARLMVSEIYHDHERELEAAEALQPVVELLKKPNEEVVERVTQAPINRSPASIVSRRHLFLAIDHRNKKQFDKQLQHLKQGVAEDASDADLLIAMYRAEGADAAFKKEAAEQIDKYLAASRKQIAELKRYEQQAPNEANRNDINNAMAGVNNQIAWLAGNTERDIEEAIKSSHRSLELRPKTAAYLDTLAHCYFAAGKFDEAVTYQTQAVALEPYSFQIVKKLKIFQEAAKANAKKGK